MVLQGVSDICSLEVSFKALGKLLDQPELSVIVDCQAMVADLTEEKAVPAAFQKLIARFQQVFEEPHGLPRSRGREHAITLSQGSNSVSVQPFCYPHRRKRYIERQVTAMLKAGIIQENISHFQAQRCSQRRTVVAVFVLTTGLYWRGF